MDTPLIAKTPCLFIVTELYGCACEMRLNDLLHSLLARIHVAGYPQNGTKLIRSEITPKKAKSYSLLNGYHGVSRNHYAVTHGREGESDIAEERLLSLVYMP